MRLFGKFSFSNKLLFQYMSDLHLEKNNIPKLEIKAPYLILAGDIGIPETDNYQTFIEYCSKSFEKVFMVSGNHEYYQINKMFPKTIDEVNVEINDISKRYKNVHFLNQSFVNINSELKIIGCTLWASYNNTLGKKGDFKYIFKNHKDNINVKDIQGFHIAQQGFLLKQILYSQKNMEKVIVVTHHLPSYKLVKDEYRGIPYGTNFYSNSDFLIRNPVKAWVCGHSHGYMNVNINGVPVFLNAAGNSQNKRFADLLKTFSLQ